LKDIDKQIFFFDPMLTIRHIEKLEGGIKELLSAKVGKVQVTPQVLK